MLGSSPWVRLLLVAAVVAVLAPAAASAAIWLVFSRTTAAPHAVVTARTAGKGALLRLRMRGVLKRNPLRLYLAEASEAASIRSVRDRRLMPLGRLRVDKKGNGSIRFGVPNVPAGDYVTLLHCVPCARFSAGRTLVLVGPRPGPFRVVEAAIPIRTCQSSVYGQLTEDQIAAAPRFGPVRLINYNPARGAALSTLGAFRSPATRQYSRKVLLVVERGLVATLAVARTDRRAVALSYMPQRFNIHRVTAGDAAVTFAACRGDEDHVGATEPWTQFNGSFVFARPLCAHFELRLEGRKEPLRFSLPFGRPC